MTTVVQTNRGQTDLVTDEYQKMGKLTRLVTVQGPAQLLNVLAVLDHERETRDAAACDDYLIIDGLCTPRDRDVVAAVEDLARVWEWKAVVNLKELEPEIAVGADVSERIRSSIGVGAADVIYASRNWQPTNEALLRAYAAAEKVMYGDGFGVADSYDWPGFVAFDRAALCLPIETEFGLLDRLPVQIVPRKHLHAIIDRYLACSPHVSEYAGQLAEWMEGNGVLILATNGVESSWIENLDTEVALYVEHVLRYVRPGQKVIIKPHPRESSGQSEMSRRVLEEEHGIPTMVIGGFLGALPVEILCREIRFADVLAIISISSLHLKYLYGVDCRTADKDLTLPKLRLQHRRDDEAGLDEVNLLMAKLDSWDGATILHRCSPKSDAHRVQLVQAIELLNSERYAESLTLFESLHSVGCDFPQVDYGRAAARLGQGKVLRAMLALWTLRGSPYALPASRLLESNPRARRVRDVLRGVGRRLRGIRTTPPHRVPTGAPPAVDTGERPAAAGLSG